MSKPEKIHLNNVTVDLAKKIQNLKGYEIFHNNPMEGKLILNHNGRNFNVTIEDAGESKRFSGSDTIDHIIPDRNRTRAKLDNISKENNITVDKEELDYYIEHLDISFRNITMQQNFVALVFNKYVSALDIGMMTKNEYIETVVLMKKFLIEKYNLTRLPYILSGNCISVGKVNRVDSITDRYIEHITGSTYTMVAPEFPDKFGTEIPMNKALIKDEILLVLLSV